MFRTTCGSSDLQAMLAPAFLKSVMQDAKIVVCHGCSISPYAGQKHDVPRAVGLLRNLQQQAANCAPCDGWFMIFWICVKLLFHAFPS